MVVPEAVDIVLGVHGEGNAVQALTADHAAKAAGVVGLAQSLQDLRNGEESVSQSVCHSVRCISRSERMDKQK